jgi:uncharacterized membrane protein YfcA
MGQLSMTLLKIMNLKKSYTWKHFIVIAVVLVIEAACGAYLVLTNPLYDPNYQGSDMLWILGLLIFVPMYLTKDIIIDNALILAVKITRAWKKKTSNHLNLLSRDTNNIFLFPFVATIGRGLIITPIASIFGTLGEYEQKTARWAYGIALFSSIVVAFFNRDEWGRLLQDNEECVRLGVVGGRGDENKDDTLLNDS